MSLFWIGIQRLTGSEIEQHHDAGKNAGEGNGNEEGFLILIIERDQHDRHVDLSEPHNKEPPTAIRRR